MLDQIVRQTNDKFYASVGKCRKNPGIGIIELDAIRTEGMKEGQNQAGRWKVVGYLTVVYANWGGEIG